MEFRKIFDTIPEQFDRCRCRYSQELFSELIQIADIGPGKSVLELGPGTGQATDPILNTGCDYHAIELGEHLAAKMIEKYSTYDNFQLVNDDFITHDFGSQQFDLIYSAATIQWIPEEVAFSKTFDLLKPGGILAMLLMRGDYKSTNEKLFNQIQDIYAQFFKPEQEYTHRSFGYKNALDYGFVDFEEREFLGTRTFNADEYVDYCGTHCDHLVITEPYKSKFFDGIYRCIKDAGNQLVAKETYVMMTVRKPV